MGGKAGPDADAVSAQAAPAQASPAPSAPCLLINPKSHGAAHGALAARAAELARARNVDVFEAAGAADFDAALAVLLRQRRQALFVLAGDGTVQALADRLVSLPAGVPPPRLLVLGGGRSNVIAADLGGHGAVLSKLEAALMRWRDGPPLALQMRHVLRIEQPPARARHGFFLGAGLVDCAIRACHRYRDGGAGKLRSSDAGTLWTLARLALPAMLGIREPRIDELLVDAPGYDALSRPARWLMATTLQTPKGSLNPYARRGSGDVRFTAIAARGLPFWARLPWIATGRFTPAMNAECGYLSGRCDALRVLGLSSYTLDGEEFAADPARAVTIGKGPRLSFLTL